MEDLKLRKTITILGGVKRSGKTRFALKWANYLAKDKKVLFLSWSSFSERLIYILEEMGETISKNLLIETNYDVFDIKAFSEIDNRLSRDSFDIIFFDDLHLSSFDQFEAFPYEESFKILTPLLFLANEFNVKIILVSDLSVFHQSDGSDNMYDIIQYFQRIYNNRWPKKLMQHTCQILFLFRPYLHNYKTDKNGCSTQNIVELHDIRNNSIESTFRFDNLNEKIFSSYQKEN